MKKTQGSISGRLDMDYMLSSQRLTALGAWHMATLTVRNLDEDVVRRLRIRAAERGCSAEAEHRAILRAALMGDDPQSARQQAVARLAEFRRRASGRGSPTSSELLEQSRAARMDALTGVDEAG
jgi:plasmid stability protein